MDYLEQMIINSWNKIPHQFKNRITNLGLTLEDELKESSQTRASFSTTIQAFDYPRKIIFYRKPIERDFQRIIDKIMIHELAHYFGFNEEEAYELMSNKNL